MRKSIAQSIKWKLEHGEPIFALNYARTSTTKDEQKDSCDNQVAMARIYLERNPNIILAEPPYVDQGISGKSNLHREQYEKMIERIKKGDIDLLIVKTKARLCRSKAISASLEEMMRDYRFSILTLSDGQIYDSTDRSSRLINGIKDVIDEDYVWGQSEYGRLTHQLRCQKKVLNNSAVVYGYGWDKEKKDLYIIPEEAEVIRQIFEMYVYEDIGVSEIAKRLAQQGIYGKMNGNVISANSLTSWLENEAYTGNFYINKKGSELELGNNRETKIYKIPKEEWIAVPRPDLAIIDRELFDLAKRIREARRSVYATSEENSRKEHFKGYHLFASKVFCGECGSQFIFTYTDRDKTIGAYKDHFLWKSHALDHCENKKFHRVYEETLSKITKEAINRLVANRDDVFDHLTGVLEKAYGEAGKKKESDRKKGKDDSKLRKYEAERVSYFESWRTAPDDGMKAYFYEKIQEITLKIAKEEGQKQEGKQEEAEVAVPIEEQMKRVRKALDSFRHIETVTKDIVDAFVQKITIYKDGKVDIILKTGYKFGADITGEPAYSRQRKAPIIMDAGKTSERCGDKEADIHDMTKDGRNILNAFSYDMNVKPQTRGVYHGYKGAVLNTKVSVQI